VGCLMLSSTWCFIVQLLRYYKAISVELVTANHLFYEGLEESEHFFHLRLDFPYGISQFLQSSFLFACLREEAVMCLIILK